MVAEQKSTDRKEHVLLEKREVRTLLGEGVVSSVGQKQLSDICLLLCGLLSGLTSPSRTTLTCCSLSTKLVNLDCLTLPTGIRRTLKRAGTTMDKGSRLMVHSIMRGFRRSPQETWEV